MRNFFEIDCTFFHVSVISEKYKTNTSTPFDPISLSLSSIFIHSTMKEKLMVVGSTTSMRKRLIQRPNCDERKFDGPIYATRRCKKQYSQKIILHLTSSLAFPSSPDFLATVYSSPQPFSQEWGFVYLEPLAAITRSDSVPLSLSSFTSTLTSLSSTMPYLGESTQIPPEYPSDLTGQDPVSSPNPRASLQNLSEVHARMDSLHGFLTESVNFKALLSKDQMDTVSSEIASAIQQIVVSGTALIASSRIPDPPDRNLVPGLKVEEEETETGVAKKDEEDDGDGDIEIVELDSVELLAEHIHFCEICGKGFKRDANLRMHMRAHGNRFKTREALTKPERNGSELSSRIRFSCPYVGCNRNKRHKKFRALKSVVCVKNHFKRSHCPKMFSCNRCKRKSFAVLGDLKSHLKHCGESKWRCTCGTMFSRKDKLFGHVALFEGHMPAVVDDDIEKFKSVVNAMDQEDEDEELAVTAGKLSANLEEDEEEFFQGLLNGFDSIQGFWSP